MPNDRTRKSIAIYIRARSNDHEALGRSVADQLSECVAHAASLSGPEVQPVVFVDLAVSANVGFEPAAGKPARPGLRALVQAIRAGEIGTVLCLDADRLARSSVLLARFADICREHSVNVRILQAGRCLRITSIPALNSLLGL